jgi:hypothetical protein
MGWLTFLVAVAALIALQRLTLGRIQSRRAPAPVELAGETA